MALDQARELQRYILNGIQRTGRSLGSGSFGRVEEVIHAGARCAGKVIHEGLIESRGSGHHDMIKKIEYECSIMSALRHPNIVQFLGICFFEESTVPVIVMECLEANLETLLTQTSSLSIHAKISVLLDVAKGLVYLHSHSPPIVHRDLTARNVLLTNTLLAKIADLGNSRIIESNALTRTLSMVPGTLVYMPPEALGNPPQYNEKLDIFSYGHLALYTVLQDFPCELLLGVYNDPKNPDRTYARNEVERRFRYIEKLRAKFRPTHTLTKLVTECLHNHPQIRPSAAQVFQLLQTLQREQGGESMRFSLSDFIQDVPEEKVQYHGNQPAIQNLLERIQNGGMDTLEREMRTRMGKTKWKKYAFQISGTTLQCFSKMNKGPEEVIQLGKITDVDYLDSGPNDPYQFIVIMEGHKIWKLKTNSEESRHCWITALRPQPVRYKGKQDLYTANPRGHLRRRDTGDDVDAYAYVQMAPPAHRPGPMLPPGAPRASRVYQHLGDQNKLQPYVQIQGEEFQEQLAQDKTQNVYDIPKNQGFNKQPQEILHIPPTYDIPRIRSKSRCASPFKEVAEEEQPSNVQEEQPSLLMPPGGGKKGAGENRLSVNVEDMDSEQIQLLISQLQSMGVLEQPAATVEELYPECGSDDTYESISDEDDHLYDDVSDVAEPKPLYVNIDQIGEVEPEATQPRKKKPTPPPRVRRTDKAKFEEQRKGSVGFLLSEVSNLISHSDGGQDVIPEQYVHRPKWSKASTASSTVKADDPLLSAGQRSLYISRQAIQNMKKIGEGQFGEVFKAVLRSSSGRKIDVAIKKIKDYSSEKEMSDFLGEMAVMSQLEHRNIIHLHGVVKEKNWIILEYLPNGDLKTFLTNNHRPIRSLVKYMTDVAMGMLYLSDKRIIHRDLAARNVMVGKNETCKVADFGLLRELDDYKEVYVSSNIALCPLRWMAPESLKDKHFSTASDVWSYGILIWEMFNPSVDIPYPDLDDMQVAAMLVTGYTMPIPTQCPPVVASIMKFCWQSDPSKRPSFALISVMLTHSKLQETV